MRRNELESSQLVPSSFSQSVDSACVSQSGSGLGTVRDPPTASRPERGPARDDVIGLSHQIGSLIGPPHSSFVAQLAPPAGVTACLPEPQARERLAFEGTPCASSSHFTILLVYSTSSSDPRSSSSIRSVLLHCLTFRMAWQHCRLSAYGCSAHWISYTSTPLTTDLGAAPGAQQPAL